MADETQARASTGRDVRSGAQPSAPTAPHATERAAGVRPTTGPERFWTSRWARLALVASFALSIAFHYAIGPWRLFPDRTLEIRDVAGDLAIPVDLMEGEPEPPPPPPPPVTPEVKPGGDPAGLDASAPLRKDSGARDAGAPHDAARESGESDAGAEDGLGDAMVAAREAEGGQNGPRDAVGMIGAAGNAQAGPQLVVLIVNMAVIRAHPVGAQMGPLLSAIPQWDDFISGTHVDPVRDTDWILINGPSLINTGRDAILVHYSAPDAVVDHAITTVAHKYDRGGPYDAGVPGVKAALGHADRYERVFLRPQPHLLAVVPRDYAKTAAQILSKAAIKAPRAGEAMRLKLVHPHGPIPDFPESITELRVWILPHADGGAEVFGEGDATDPGAAADAASHLSRVSRDMNSLGVQLVTHGLLNGLSFTADGSTLRVHLPASKDQIELLLALVAGKLGVTLPPPPPGAVP